MFTSLLSLILTDQNTNMEEFSAKQLVTNSYKKVLKEVTKEAKKEGRKLHKGVDERKEGKCKKV